MQESLRLSLSIYEECCHLTTAGAPASGPAAPVFLIPLSEKCRRRGLGEPPLLLRERNRYGNQRRYHSNVGQPFQRLVLCKNSCRPASHCEPVSVTRRISPNSSVTHFTLDSKYLSGFGSQPLPRLSVDIG